MIVVGFIVLASVAVVFPEPVDDEGVGIVGFDGVLDCVLDLLVDRLRSRSNAARAQICHRQKC